MPGELDKDLAKALQVAKKKPRNFAIIAKGANVLKLLVEKKPIKDGAIVKAKKEVQGNLVIQGVVRGDGGDLVFEVLEETSIAEPKLKKFIADTTWLPLKPRFQVVAKIEAIDDDLADDAVETESTSQPSSATSPPEATSVPPSTPPATEPPPPSGPSSDQLVASLNKLSPVIKQAVMNHPDRKADILKPVAAFQAHIQAGDLAAAKECLLQIGSLLKSLAASAGAPGGESEPRSEELPSRGLSLVALAKARMAWPEVRDAAIRDIRHLKDVVWNTFKDDTEQATELAAAMQVLDLKIRELDNQLHKELDAVLNGSEADRPKLIRAARTTLDGVLTLLASDPVFIAIDDNEAVPGMLVRAPLEEQLNAIWVALG